VIGAFGRVLHEEKKLKASKCWTFKFEVTLLVLVKNVRLRVRRAKNYYREAV
jgi:hypothetical protein